jgi:cytoskeletal protein CcmA (bactofilin family)
MSVVDIRTKTAISGKDASALKKEITHLKSMPTIISKDLIIDGDVVSLGLIEIEGQIKGSIKGNSVVLREEGFVEGTIVAESISIRGRFEGNISAQNISVSSKGKILGNIEYGSLEVEDGASIEGQFKKLSS